MTQDIFVQVKSDIIVSTKTGKKYFTVQDDTDNKYICFNPKFHPLFEVGNVTVGVDVQPGRTADDTPRIANVGVKAEEVVQKVETQLPHKESIYKADPDKIESIERQSSLKSAVEWCSVKVQAGVDIKTEEVIRVAEKFLEYIANIKK